MPYGVQPPFKPTGATLAMALTTTAGYAVIPPGGDTVRIANPPGNPAVRAAFGSDNTIIAQDPIAGANGVVGTSNPSGFTTGNGTLILPGEVMLFSVPPSMTFISAKTETGTGNIEIQRGDGS